MKVLAVVDVQKIDGVSNVKKSCITAAPEANPIEIIQPKINGHGHD